VRRNERYVRQARYGIDPTSTTQAGVASRTRCSNGRAVTPDSYGTDRTQQTPAGPVYGIPFRQYGCPPPEPTRPEARRLNESEMDMLPNDQRAFVHKRIIGAVGGFVSGGGVTGAIRGFAQGGGGGSTFTGANRGQGLGQTAINIGTRAISRAQCGPGMKRDARGLCVREGGFFPAGERFFGRDLPSRGGGGTALALRDDFGMAVMGRYGPALEPAVEGRTVRICPPGAVLGDDGLCYDKGSHGARRAHRLWKPERPPFLPRRDLAALDRVAALKRNKVLRRRFKALGLG